MGEGGRGWPGDWQAKCGPDRGQGATGGRARLAPVACVRAWAAGVWAGLGGGRRTKGARQPAGQHSPGAARLLHGQWVPGACRARRLGARRQVLKTVAAHNVGDLNFWLFSPATGTNFRPLIHPGGSDGRPNK